jgi:hypothetical protein
MNIDMPSGHRLIQADGIIISQERDTYTKSVIIRDIFLELSKKYKVDKIVIEENLQAFRRGFSSARTLSTLARFNGIVSFLAQDVFHVSTIMLNVNSARSKIGLKVDRKSEIPIKEQILKWVKSHPDFSGYEWPTKVMKSGPRRGMRVQAKECYDIADAAVICLAGDDT